MKKGIAILLVTILVIDLSSCVTYKQLSIQQDFEIYQDKQQVQILEIHSKRDSIVVFNEKFPGKLANKQVYGLPQIQFPYSMSDTIFFTSSKPKAAYIRHNGTQYLIISQEKSGLICLAPDTILTPFSDVTMMKVKRKDTLKSTLLIVGLSAVFVGLAVYIMNSSSLDLGGINI